MPRKKQNLKRKRLRGLKKLILAPLILRNPQITEKATRLQESNCYVFKVYQRANKPEIKKAIEEKYNVKVVSLRTINAPRKRKRLGRSIGWQKGYKKAVIGLEKGQSIEIMPR